MPVYYPTLVRRWILAEGYVVDTVQNKIVLHLGHFTTFGLAEMEAREKEVYLPLVLRNP